MALDGRAREAPCSHARRPPSSARRATTVPTAFGPGTGHPVGGAPIVTFSGLAVARNAPATYANGTCKNVYCHGQNLVGHGGEVAVVDRHERGREQVRLVPRATSVGAPHRDREVRLCHGTVDPTPAGPTHPPGKRDLHVDGQVNR